MVNFFSLNRNVFSLMALLIAMIGYVSSCTKASSNKRSAYNCQTNPEQCNGGIDPADPDLSAPISGEFKFSVPADIVAGTEIVITWQKLDGATNYTLTIARDKSCTNHIVKIPKISGESQPVIVSDAGTFYVCVDGVKSDGSTVAAEENGKEITVKSSSNNLPSYSNGSGSNLTGLSGDGSSGTPYAFSINEESSNGEYSFDVSDADGETVTVSSTDKPSWVTIVDVSATSKKLTFNPSASGIGTKAFSVKLTDAKGGEKQIYFSITVSEQNDAVTDVSLDSVIINENAGANGVIGDLSATDEDSGDSHTFTLVAGTGDTDNGSFNISGNSLRATSSLDFETKSSYSVRVRGADGSTNFEKAFSITVVNVNEIPTDMALSVTTVNENVAGGTTIGALSTTDEDSGESFTYTLVAGAGDTHNSSFTISSANLNINSSPNYEGINTYYFRVRTTDSASNTYEEQMMVTVIDLNENPTDISLSSSSIDENNSINDVIGTLSTTEPDGSQTHTYNLQSGCGGTHNASFNISGSSLRAGAVFDYETQTSYTVCVRTTDNGTGSLTYERTLTISINDDTTPPPALTSFSGVTGSKFAEIDLSLDYPATLTDYDNIKIYRNTTGSASTGVAAPSCGSGTLVTTVTNFAPDPSTLSIDPGGANLYYSFRACIYDAEGLVTSTNTAIDVRSRNGPSLTRHYDAQDVDGAGTQSGDIQTKTDTTWDDLSGTADATLTNFNFNTANSGWDGDGTVGDPYTLKFDGSNDYVSGGAATNFNTIAFWFKSHGHSNDTLRTVFNGPQTGNSRAVNIALIEGKLHFNYDCGWCVNQLATGVSADRWYHFAMANNGSTTYFYLDGELATSISASLDNHTFYLGRNDAGNYFDGEIADFRVYNAQLIADEVAYLYVDGRSRFVASPGANPSIERVLSSYNTTTGLESFSIFGWNLSSITGVTIDSNNATSLIPVNSGYLTANSPAGSVGLQDVVVTDGSNPDTATGAFAYSAAPADNLLLLLDARNIDGKGTPATGTATRNDWVSMASGMRGGMMDFTLGVSDPNSGWDGAGVPANPRRLKFDGTNDFVGIGSYAPQTIMVWFNTDTNTSGFLFNAGMDGNDKKTNAEFVSGKLEVNYNCSWCAAEASVRVDTGTWYQLTITNDGTTSLFYLNGSVFGSASKGAMASDRFAIGRDDWLGAHFNGSIAEFRMYSDALTTTEVEALYVEGRARFPVANHTLFASSTGTYTGNLGGLRGADETCHSLADGASLSGAWKAVLSDSTRNAKDRIHITGSISNTNSDSLATNATDLWDGTIANTVGYDESGNSVGSAAWTGSDSTGTAISDHCSNWTVGVAGTWGGDGRVSNTNSQWIDDISPFCGSSRRIYCISQ